MNKYQIVYEACKEATKKRIKYHSKHFDRETMLLYPKDYCSFRPFIDIEQDAVKDLTGYLRRHHKHMGLKPVHGPGECARYVFVVTPFLKKLMDSALELKDNL
jgi:hypothetical protein